MNDGCLAIGAGGDGSRDCPVRAPYPNPSTARTILDTAVEELRAPADLLTDAPPVALADAEREHIPSALREANWMLGGPNRAAVAALSQFFFSTYIAVRMRSADSDSRLSPRRFSTANCARISYSSSARSYYLGREAPHSCRGDPSG
jgi:hypothetical protein